MRSAFSKDVRDFAAGALILFFVVTFAFAPFAYGDRTLMSGAEDTASIFITGGVPQPPANNILKVLDPGAGSWQTEPELLLEHDQWRNEHVFPLWNPYVGYGQPLAADMQAQPFYPLAWIVAISRSVRAYDWFIVLRFYVAALFAFLFLRVFVRFAAAITGGIAFAFSGYFFLYYNMPHISVECLVPALLWAMELLVRRRSAVALVRLSVVEAIVIFGGMPESALLAIAFAYAYFAVRVLADLEQRSTWKSALVRLAGASALGVGLASCLLDPFVEFVHRSSNVHEARLTGVISGLVHDDFSFGFVAPYLTPLIYGPPYGNIFANFTGWTTIRGWFGVGVSFFAIIAVSSSLVQLRQRAVETWSPVPFFFVVAVILELKRFGSPLVNWIGALPGFSLVVFPKYDEAIVAFCVASLATVGIDRVATARARAFDGWIAAALLLGIFTVMAGINKPQFEALASHRHFYAGSMAGGLAVLVVVGCLTWLAVRTSRYGPPTRFAWLACAVILAESLCSYFIPLWYVVDEPAPVARSPISGAAYVTFVRQATLARHERFFGEDGLLYPEWSSAFGIDDVRELNALYDYRYLAFVRAFLRPVADDDLRDRFVGVGSPDFRDALGQRFLQLSSVGYVAAAHTFGGDPSLLAKALSARPEDQSPTLRRGSYEIDGSRRDITFMHVPRFRYPVNVTVPRDARVLRYAYAMAPDVWTNPGLRCGDGVTFVLELRDSKGLVSTLLRSYIDPKHNSADRKWFDLTADISRWRGLPVQLLFSTLPGPSGSTCADWALWSGIGFDSHHDAVGNWPFRPVFHSHDVSIYRFDNALPRLALYTNVSRVTSDAAALDRLVNEGFNPAKEAVITMAPGTTPTGLASITGDGRDVSSGTIDRYESQDVSGSVDALRPSLVVLNDTDYPGWVATVDGHPSAIVTANYMFRGVVVPSGHHTIEFRYRPLSFLIGGTITAVSALLALVYVLGAYRRRKREGVTR